MTAPTTPFCTPALAGILSKSLFRGQNPSSTTSVKDSDLEQLIAWTDAQLCGDFRSIGYKVPFIEISGETWPTDQTTLLQFWSAVGAMAMASGYILRPSPQMLPGRSGGERNVYAVLIEAARRDIREHGYHFRAQTYIGTKAEELLTEPQGPRTDFGQDYVDPTRFELMHAYTDRMREVFSDIKVMNLEWDYVYELRAESKS